MDFFLPKTSGTYEDTNRTTPDNCVYNIVLNGKLMSILTGNGFLDFFFFPEVSIVSTHTNYLVNVSCYRHLSLL